MKKILRYSALTVTLGFSACGGGGGDGDDSGEVNGDVAGVYGGRFSEQPFGQAADLTGAISPNGALLLYSLEQGRVYTGTLDTGSDAVTGLFRAYDAVRETDFGFAALAAKEGSLSGPQTATGVAGTYQVSGGSQSGTFSLTRQEASDFEADLSLLDGIWSNQDATTGYAFTLTIQPSGTFNGSDTNGCVYSGAITLSTPQVNVYQTTGSINCPGLPAVTNATGVAFRILPPSGEAIVLSLANPLGAAVAMLKKQ